MTPTPTRPFFQHPAGELISAQNQLVLLNEISRLKRDLDDTRTALDAANEHSDALQDYLYRSAENMQAEVHRRQAVQSRLEALIDAIRQENGDLKTLVDILIDQGDTAARYEEAAHCDGLTGIQNRRGFDEFMAREWDKCAMKNRSFSLIMADVDHFKLYNDRYGHVAGDECLRTVAAAIRDCCPRTSLVARYGGEEFAVALPGEEPAPAFGLGLAVRAAVAACGLPHVDSKEHGRVTVSVGVATVRPGVQGSQWLGLVELADGWLYRAKRGGRNQVQAECSGCLKSV